MNKEYIITHYEQDWDDDNIYYSVREDGLIVKVNVETGDRMEYFMERVVH
ncbi:hypothetical protein [Heyndrickxia camelliae]|nr:hypothetical protein [Heyndrickxia camelliae]